MVWIHSPKAIGFDRFLQENGQKNLVHPVNPV